MSGYLRPAGNGVPISSSWSDHRNRRPPSGEPGTDYACAYGTTLVAPSSGVVITTKNDNSGAMGRRIIIQFDDGNSVDLIHLSEIWVREGQRVNAGQQIGKSGASAGGSNWGVGSHVHVSLWIGGTPYTKGWASTADFEAHAGGGGSSFSRAVQMSQEWLNMFRGEKLVTDGIRGPATIAAYKRYQTFLGVTADGIWGEATQAAHAKVYAKWEADRNKGNGGGSSTILATEMLKWSRDEWKGIQRMLKSDFGYRGAIDGIPGNGTIVALQSFLYSKGYDDRAGVGPLKRDGQLGNATVKAAQQWLKERWSYSGAIDGQPGAGTRAAWQRANSANNSAFSNVN